MQRDNLCVIPNINMNTQSIPAAPLPKNAQRKIRVLIVDDSPLIRTVLEAMLEDVADIEVVGQASNGQEAVRLTVRLKPDVLTLDIRMPQMDGLEATRHIMSVRPTPIIVVANSVYASDYNIAFKAIEAGALTVIEKPRGLGSTDYEAVRAELLTAIRMLADVKLVARRPSSAPKLDKHGPMTGMLNAMVTRPIQVIAIASSTGGPGVLMQILGSLPADFSIPIAIVQHITPTFATGLADWLKTGSNLLVAVAEEGERIIPGKVLVAPSGVHLTITGGGIVRLDPSPPIKSSCPSATRLFESVAQTFGVNSVGIILTGMGDDGVDGLAKLSQLGAHVIAQDEESCVVFGMPKAAIERGIVDEVLSPEGIASRLIKFHRHVQTLARL